MILRSYFHIAFLHTHTYTHIYHLNYIKRKKINKMSASQKQETYKWN